MTIQELCERMGNGTRVIGETLIGIYGGFPFSIVLTPKKKSELVAVRISANRQIPNKIWRTARKNLRKVQFQAGGASNILWAQGVSSAETDAYALSMRILDACTAALNGAKKPVLPPQHCHICNKGNCDSVALFGAIYSPVHRGCVIRQNVTTNKKAVRNEESGNYILGIIGAILGAAVGFILNLLIITFLKVEFGLLYGVIPLASYWGYELFRGKLGNVARVAVILSTILAFIVSQPALYYIKWIRDGTSDGLIADFIYYFNYVTLDVLLRDIWYGLIFLLLGIAVSFKALGKTNRDIMQTAEMTLESVTNRDGTHTPVRNYELAIDD